MDDKELENRIKKIDRELKQRASKLCLGNNVNAEDLYQDTYVKIWSNRHMYRTDEFFKAWCLRIMYNLFIDQVKVENRYYSVEPNNEYTDRDYIFDSLINTPSHNNAPSTIDYEDMINSLELLSDRDKRILEMFFIEGYNQEEIGKHFNITPNNVKQRVYNAVRLVREDLKDKFDIDETYFEKDGLLEIQKRFRKKSTQLESNYRKRFEK